MKSLRKMILLMVFMAVQSLNASASKDTSHDLVILKNLQADLALAEQKCLPLAIMVSQFSCTYCVQLRQSVLQPMLKSGEFIDQAIFRELLIDPNETVIAQSGKVISGQTLAANYIKNMITPTMLIVDPSGNEIAKQIVGIGNIDYYGSYFEKKLEAALAITQKQCVQHAVSQ